MMRPTDFCVETSEQLAQVGKKQLDPAVRRIRLLGPLADERLERQINRAYFACGCETGSIAVMAALVTSVAGGFVFGFAGHFEWWRIIAYLAGAAFAGKLLGLATARIQLGRAVSKLSGTVSWQS